MIWEKQETVYINIFFKRQSEEGREGTEAGNEGVRAWEIYVPATETLQRPIFQLRRWERLHAPAGLAD